MTKLLLVLALAWSTAAATMHRAFSQTPIPNWPGLTVEQLDDVTAEAAAAAGINLDDICVIPNASASRVPAKTKCKLVNQPNHPCHGKRVIHIYPHVMCHKAVYDAGCTDANGNEDYSNLFKGDNRGELLTTLIHEMKHHCQFDNGQTCFEDLPYPPLVKQQLNDFCLELSIDLTIYADLCALVQTKCTALCDLLSQPIQAGSPEALEAWRLRSEILGLCRSMELLRARYNTNEWASRLCKCRNGVYTGDGVQYPPDSQACSTIMPPYPAGGTPPPDCEYTNDPQLLPECNNCPCVCTQSTWFNNGEPALY